MTYAPKTLNEALGALEECRKRSVDRQLAVDELSRRQNELIWFIHAEGYRRCDSPACNCPYFHGGDASERLTEISDELGIYRTNGTTILKAVRKLVDEEDARCGN
jgi:hypothetical protein